MRRRRDGRGAVDPMITMQMTLRPEEHHREYWARHGAPILREGGPTGHSQPLRFFGPPPGWTASDQQARDELAASERREQAERGARSAFQADPESE